MKNNSTGFKSSPYVSVIIPTYRDWGRLQLCLNALEKQSYPQEKTEILIVNNDPENEPPQYLKLPDNCMLLKEHNPGSYAARNKALAIAQGGLYAFTDSDCQPHENWLSVAVDFFEKNSDYCRIGGKIDLFSNAEKISWYEIYDIVFAFPQEDFVSESGMAATGNMISKKMVFEKIGFFNKALMSGGDSEWGRRANSQGFKIKYVSECIVYHPTRSSFKAITLKNRRLIGGRFYLAKEKGRASQAQLMLRSMMPPINAIKKVVKREDICFKYKAVAVFLSFCVKYQASWELMKLILGKGEAEKL